MRTHGIFFLILAAATCGFWETPAQAATTRWEDSIVTLDVARKDYDFRQPWNTRTRSTTKTGVVVGEHEILTTADELFDRTLVRIQKGGGGEWWAGQVAWIDYHANLAVITADSNAFWQGLRPVQFGSATKDKNWRIARWRQGNLEVRQAEFTVFAVRLAELSDVNYVTLGCDSDIQGLRGGEPILANNHCVGLVTSQSGRSCVATPASMIEFILKARRANTYHGLGYFHWIWQPAVNTDSLRRFQLTGPPRGVIVIDVPARRDGVEQVVKPGDVILQVAGFDVDTVGNYRDPEFGLIMLENLSTRKRCAGDEVPLKILRDGKELEVSYRLPKYEYNLSLVPAARYDREPEFFSVGGLVFQPLDREFLETWGADWQKNAPMRLSYYHGQPVTERPALVVLSQVLPDPYNTGYQEQRYLVVDKVNGTLISRVQQIQEALKHPVNGFHIIEYMRGDSLQRMVLRAGAVESEATERTLKRYGIPQAFRFTPDSAQ